MGISLLYLEEMNMCDENVNLEEQVTEPVEPKVETEPLFENRVHLCSNQIIFYPYIIEQQAM